MYNKVTGKVSVDKLINNLRSILARCSLGSSIKYTRKQGMSRTASNAGRSMESNKENKLDMDLIEEGTVFRACKPPLIKESPLPEEANLSRASKETVLEVLSCAGAFCMPKGIMCWNCPHMLSGFGTGSRPVEHVVSGCLLGRSREDDEGERMPGWCRACGSHVRRMKRLRQHIRFECDASEICEKCCEKTLFVIPYDGDRVKACDNCMRVHNAHYIH